MGVAGLLVSFPLFVLQFRAIFSSPLASFHSLSAHLSCAPEKRIFLFFLWGDPVQNRPQNPAPAGCLFSTRKTRSEVPERGDLGEENCLGRGVDRAKKRKKDAQKQGGSVYLYISLFFLGPPRKGTNLRGQTPICNFLHNSARISWAAPTVSYLWPTRTELSRKVSENQKFPDRNISVICPGRCRVTEIQITSCPSKKELFTSHFCDLCRGCAASRKSFLRLHFLTF